MDIEGEVMPFENEYLFTCYEGSLFWFTRHECEVDFDIKANAFIIASSSLCSFLSIALLKRLLKPSRISCIDLLLFFDDDRDEDDMMDATGMEELNVNT